MSLKIDMKNAVDKKSDATNFTVQLIKLIIKADYNNRWRLKRSFPNAVATVEYWEKTSQYLDLPYDDN